jgi:hypothetical protein
VYQRYYPPSLLQPTRWTSKLTVDCIVLQNSSLLVKLSEVSQLQRFCGRSWYGGAAGLVIYLLHSDRSVLHVMHEQADNAGRRWLCHVFSLPVTLCGVEIYLRLTCKYRTISSLWFSVMNMRTVASK